MSTYRDLVSRIRSLNKLISGDNLITDRVIVSELNSKASFFIKREVDRRKLWASSNIFTSIPCVELETVPISECCDFISDKKIAKSKIKLPKIGEGNYGFLIQGVFSTEISFKLTEVTPSRLINILKLNLKTKNVYYWIQNQYLYLSDPNVKLVSLSAYFEENVPNNLLAAECDCVPGLKKYERCQNPLDREFKAPGYLEDTIVTSTIKTLLDTYFRVPVDHTQDEKDDTVNKV
jgi:hypothetical protein